LSFYDNTDPRKFQIVGFEKFFMFWFLFD